MMNLSGIKIENWDEEITFGDGSTHKAGSVHEILMNSKNKREKIINCAQQ